MKKKVMMVLGAVGALAIGLFAVAAVGAQEVDDVTRPLDNLVSKVADKLGVSDEEFVDAWNDSAIELIDEAVANGDLDPDKAAEMKDRIAESDGIFVPRPPDRPPHDRPHDRFQVYKLIFRSANTVLDLEEGELAEALHSGHSLLDVALENGFTEEEFTEALLEQVGEQLDELVANGEIGEEAAAMIFERISENIAEIINHTFDDGPRPHGPGGPGPFGSDVPETDVATTDI